MWWSAWPVTLLLYSTLFKFSARAQSAILPAPGQPSHQGNIGGFEIIGSSLVSAQQIFLGTTSKVYFIDKVENNPTQINGHPAWASEWSLGTNTQRPMDALTNTFCAGGNVLANGTWINVGGNQAVTSGGQPAASQDGGDPYDDPDGRNSIRLLTPCDDGSCNWILSPAQSDQRWYPTLETLQDGSIFILGGCRIGGYVNDVNQDNPTYEFFPPKNGGTILSPILQRTLPANLFPLTWLLPSGNIFIQSNWETALLNLANNVETPLDFIPDAVRVYPASAGSIMLPLTPANNYTATILFCGGSDIQPDTWLSSTFIIPTYPASKSCVTITPDHSRSYQEEDPLPVARSMANLISLPDGKILALNGAKLGTSGYGDQSWAIGHSYANSPVLMPAIYDPNAAKGSRWSSAGLQASTVPRLYHSSAILLPDGSVIVSGSNPNPDYVADATFPTEYRTELFYPSYFNERRPQPNGIISQLSYGGPSFDIFLDSDDLFGDVKNVNSSTVVIIRPGFSTHAMNMGQRYLELSTTYTGYDVNNTAVLHVSQLPPNPAIIAPGPALIFVVVNGVPSIGLPVMLGSGQIGNQTLLSVANLPSATIVAKSAATSESSSLHSGGSILHVDITNLFANWLLPICTYLIFSY